MVVCFDRATVAQGVPIFSSISAGFVSPAEDHYEEQLNLNSFLIRNPSSTFVYTVEDNAMYASGINEGDIVIFEKSAKFPLGKVVVANVSGQVIIRRLSQVNKDLYLNSDSLKYSPVKLTKEIDYSILGIACYSIHHFRSDFNKHIEKNNDLHSVLIPNPISTFFVRVSGCSMIKAGIFDKDILIVDRSILPTPDNVVIAYLDGGFTVKRLKKTKVSFILFPENDDFSSIELTEEMESQLWGVVTHCIHKVI